MPQRERNIRSLQMIGLRGQRHQYHVQMQYQTAYKSVDNGQSGQVTFDGYVNRANCYVDIGSSCDANEIQVEITHMELEVYNYYDYYEPYGNDACFNTIHFNWIKKMVKLLNNPDFLVETILHVTSIRLITIWRSSFSTSHFQVTATFKLNSVNPVMSPVMSH